MYIKASLPNSRTKWWIGYRRFGSIAGVEEFTKRKILCLAQSGMICPF